MPQNGCPIWSQFALMYIMRVVSIRRCVHFIGAMIVLLLSVVFLARGRLTSRPDSNCQHDSQKLCLLQAVGTGSVYTGILVLQSLIFVCYTDWTSEDSRFCWRQRQESHLKGSQAGSTQPTFQWVAG
jgi:hypothetical protein